MAEFNRYSLYKNTPSSKYYRDYYNPIEIRYDDSDIYIIVTSEYQFRPGKLANDMLGSPRLFWVFEYFNPNQISDPIFDLKEGMILRIPTQDRLMRYF